MLKKLVTYSLLICMLLCSISVCAEELEAAASEELEAAAVEESGYEVLLEENFDNIVLSEEENLPYFLDQELEERIGACVQYRLYDSTPVLYSDKDPRVAESGSITEFDPANAISIVDGELKITKADNTRAMSLVFGLNEGEMTYNDAAAAKITSGIIKLSADIRFDSSNGNGLPAGQTHSSIPFMGLSSKYKTSVAGINHNSNTAYFKGNNTGYVHKVDNSAWNKTSVNHIEIYVDYGSNTAWAVVNDAITSVGAPKTGGISFLEFLLEKKSTTDGYYIDNLKVEKFISPEVIDTSFVDGSTDVDPEDEIFFELSQPVKPESVSNIEIYVNGVKEEVPEFDVSADGKKITLLNELKYSAAYKIKITSDVTDIDTDSGTTYNFSFPESEYTFNTKHEPITIDLPEEADIVNEYTDADGEPADFATATAVTKKATIEATEESIVTMIVVAYGDGGDIKAVSNYQTLTIPAGESKDFSVKIDLPEGTTEENIKTYFWENFTTIRSYNTSTVVE